MKLVTTELSETNWKVPPVTLLTVNVKVSAGTSTSVAAKFAALNTTVAPSFNVIVFAVNTGVLSFTGV